MINQTLRLFRERALPNLDSNIKCGNSLIDSDFYRNQQTSLFDDTDIRRVNQFDWQKAFPEVMARGGFDVIYGNPPYVRVQVLNEWAPLEVEYYRQCYRPANKGSRAAHALSAAGALFRRCGDNRPFRLDLSVFLAITKPWIE
jgi:hypothetical protein